MSREEERGGPVLTLPLPVRQLLAMLEAAGYSAYAVGGCVRDSLLCRIPGDWDLCTSALPPQMRTLFAGERLILTGEKHGTVAVIRGGKAYEITTYRVDGSYADHRHPDDVRFVPDVRQDLARRDFTINAMAYAPQTGLIDAFGGQNDLRARLVRCVGEPRERFGEDALRILRALRFASQLDFSVEQATAAAALELRDTVAGIAAERVFTELDKLLAGRAAGRVLGKFGAVLAGVLPEITPCMDCRQGAWHCHDVWQHTAAAVGALGPDADPIVRWATLLHDIAKPLCQSTDENGNIRFHGHNRRGAEIAQGILCRLRASRALLEEVPALILVHDCVLPQTDAEILAALHKNGALFLHRLCALKRADLAGHAQLPAVEARSAEVERFERCMAALAETGCYRIRDLAVDGRALMTAGVPAGPQLGATLDFLLQAVMAGALPNDKTALLRAAGEFAHRAGAMPGGTAK
jgi:tRNA nucleotidyltransferase (CCA-adding enzyme)